MTFLLRLLMTVSFHVVSATLTYFNVIFVEEWNLWSFLSVRIMSLWKALTMFK